MLHIDNDQGLLETATDYAQATSLKYEVRESDDKSRALTFLADSLQSWIEEDLLTYENVSGNHYLWLMLTDIGSLYRVNWREIAEVILSYANERVSA